MFVSLHKGVGLGLNIAKMLVELMGGRLSFSSEEGKGSTFSITFPTTDLKNYKLDGTPILKYKQQISGKTILIAEDNDENFMYLEELLTPSNNIIRAKTGLEAADLSGNRDFSIDVILMDVFMPEMDGIAAAKIIRKNNLAMPIIAVTALGLSISNAEFTLFDKVVSKPVDRQELINTIQEALEMHKT
jgi:CheY-like chemotaxis protein